jgi:hypothetical protein
MISLFKRFCLTLVVAQCLTTALTLSPAPVDCQGDLHIYLEILGIDVLKGLADQGIEVRAIRCDTASENKTFEFTCKRVRFEYSAPWTPQQNGVAELKFATLFGHIRAMNTGLRSVIRHQLWAEAANCATDLDCLVVRRNGQRTPKKVHGKSVDLWTPLANLW